MLAQYSWSAAEELYLDVAWEETHDWLAPKFSVLCRD